MKKSTPVIIAAILVSGLIGFFIGRNSASQQVVTTVIPKEDAAEKEYEKAQQTAIADHSDSSTLTAEEDTVVIAAAVLTETPTSTTTAPAPTPTNIQKGEATSTSSSSVGKTTLERIDMGISDKKIGEILESIAKNLENKKLAYVSKLGQDCSGIYHQIKDSIQARLPALAQHAGYTYPIYNTDRSSRQIADWYYKNNNLIIVEDAVASKNSIRPGSVMFYGKPNKKYSNITIELLTDRDNNYTPNGAIMHVATVTSVRTDENGDVLDYTIMHGRNSRVHASRSGSKEIQSNNTKGLPPFGNWSQQLVAIANIATKK